MTNPCADTARAGHGAPRREQRASVDNSAWDGGAAMSGCANSDTPASCYGSICAGKKAGDSSLQSSWALPHHKHPGDPPNATGTANALARLPQTQGLTNAAEAKTHLQNHMKAINPDYEAAAAGTPGQQRRALWMGDRRAMAEAARMTAFRAEFRHEPVMIGGKSLHQLDGYATMYGVEYDMYDMFGIYYESVHPDAASITLAADPDVAFLVNHRGMTMARTRNATLQLDSDPRGLHALAYVNPQRSDVSDLLVAIDDKNITEMSFAFMITEGEWDEEYMHFQILGFDIDRGDVSAVNYGANPYTSIAARSRELLADLMRAPDGAQREALARLAEKFGGVLVGDPRGGLRELRRDPDPAALRRAVADPVAQAAAGRSTALVQALLDADL